MDDTYDGDHDVTTENPFLLKDTLKHIAFLSGEYGGVIDLSRGDPLDPPSIRAAGVEILFEEFSTLLQRRAGQLSNNIANPLTLTEKEVREVWEEAKERSRVLNENIARDGEWVVNRLAGWQTPQIAVNKIDLLKIIARDIQGADYGDSAGDELIRIGITAQISQELPSLVHLNPDGVVVTEGASGAISAIFKMLTEIGYLQPGDLVGSMSPVYSPYNELAEKHGLCVVSLSCDPNNAYEPTEEDFKAFEENADGLKLFSLVNPSNPTGRSFSSKCLMRLGEIISRKQAVAIEDVVYRKLVSEGEFVSLQQYIPGRTFLVESVSKYHRSTGLRMGYIVVDPKAEKDMGMQFKVSLNDYLGMHYDPDHSIPTALKKAKAPAPYGIFAHTQMVSRPTQWKALLRIMLSDNDGMLFLRDLRQRWDLVYKALGVTNPIDIAMEKGLSLGFVPYYCLVDTFPMLPTWMTSAQGFSPWKFLTKLAKEKVVVLPAAKFFTNPNDHAWTVRISVANGSLNTIETAMARVKATIRACDLA
jgi:aspartate/methionine/tyrosine aminotransferase